MAHYALVGPSEAGHVLSLGSVGGALVRRGHRVTFVGGAEAAPLVERLGLPMRVLPLEDVPRASARAELLDTWLGRYRVEWFRWYAEALLRSLPQALQALAVDGALVEQVLPAGGTAAERAGVPFVTSCSAVPWNEEPDVPPHFTSWRYGPGAWPRLRNRLGYVGQRWYFWPVLRLINRRRRAWGLRPFERIDDTFSPLAQVSQFCPELDFPRRELPPCFHYVGSMASGRQLTTDQAFPWERLDGRPLVYASLGTISGRGNERVFRRILDACAGLEAQLVLALGQYGDAAESPRGRLGELPGNALVVDFAPQLALLDRAALVITHAGANTTMEALSRGVPLVAVPHRVDQFAVAARVERAGAGLVAPFHGFSSEQLRATMRRVLEEPGFRRRAGELRSALLAAGGADRAAEVAERALTTRRPVTRPLPHGEGGPR